MAFLLRLAFLALGRLAIFCRGVLLVGFIRDDGGRRRGFSQSSRRFLGAMVGLLVTGGMLRLLTVRGMDRGLLNDRVVGGGVGLSTGPLLARGLHWPRGARIERHSLAGRLDLMLFP